MDKLTLNFPNLFFFSEVFEASFFRISPLTGESLDFVTLWQNITEHL